MRNKLLLLLLLLLPAWVAWAQAPVWQNVSGITGTATTVRGSALAANGDYYIVGSYTGSADFGNGKSLTSSDQTTTDGFLARISGTTNLCTWVVSIGGTTGGDEVRGVAVNGSTVYITGYYSGSASFSNTSNAGSQPLTAVVNPSTGTGSIDVFVAKYDENGNPLGSISGGGTGSDQGYSIAVNGTNIYITGFISTSTATSTNVKFGTVTLGNSGSQDMFVARFTDNGTLAHGGALSGGGTGLDRGNAIGVGTNGIYVAGYFTGTGSTTISGTPLTGAGSNDIYVAKFTDSGSGLNNGGAVRSGGAFSDQATALTVSGTSIYVGGFFNQNATPGTPATVSISGSTLSSDNRDLFLAKYTDSGAGAGLSNGYAIRDGGANSDNVGDLALSGSTVYAVGGYTTATTIAGSSLTSNGDDAYVAKYTDTGATFSPIGAIDGGPSAGGAATTGASTVSVSGNQVVLGGFLGSPATFAPAVTGSITVPAGNTGFFAKLAQAPVLASISPNTGPVGASVTLTGTNLTGTTVVTFSGTSNNTVASVTVNGTGTQTITVNVPTGATTGNVTVTTPAGTSNGVAFTVQQPTTVASIVRTSANPTNSTAVNYTVTFGAPVTGLTAANFSLTTTGSISGTTVGTPVSTGTGSTWTVPVTTGTGSGTLTLSLANATNLSPGISTTLPFAGETYTIDKIAPTVAINSSTATSGGASSAATFAYTVTFSESVTGFVAGDVTVGNGTLAGFAGSGTTYTFNVTPSANGAVTVNVAANVAQDAAGNGNTAASQYSITYSAPTATVVSVTRLTPSPTATARVSYRVIFSSSVTGLTVNNFTTTNGGTTVTSSNVSSVSGSGTTYTVVVNTGTGDGTLRLDVANTTNTSPTIANVPYTAGEQYTITKSFAAAPTLRIQAAGSASGNSDVTAFVDVVQVLSNGTTVANGVQNNSFETNNVDPSGYKYQSDGVVASPWAFGVQAGVSRNNSAFGSTAANGDAVTFLQSIPGNNGSISQNLAVPSGSYQVSFRAIQRNYTSLDQRLNVFVNDVFVGNIQPNNIPTYDTFTSAAFNVTAPDLTATVSTTSASPTSTAPIPFSVTFSQSVGSTFTASDVTVSGGTITSGSFSGSGSGPYTFTVTPSGSGIVSVSLAANVATDANNTQNKASNILSLQFQAPTITVGPASLPNGTQNTAYSQALSASGGTAPYIYAITAGALPSGLSLSSAGTIAGTPTTNGSFNFTVTATDNSVAPGPYSGSRSYTLTISTQPVTAAPVVTAPANGSLTNNTTPTYQGTAPAGSTVTVYVDGASIGTTTAPGGSFSLVQPTALAQGSHTVYATAQTSGSTVSANSNTNTFTVDSVRPSVAISSSAGASGGSTSTSPIPYSVTFSENVTGFVASDLTVTGGTPSGFTAVSGTTYVFNVTPSTNSSTVTVNIAANVAVDQANNGNTAASQYSLTFVAPAITVGPISLPGGTQGTAYSQTLTASGGTSPYIFAITAGALPNGVTLASNGTLAGTPTINGSFNFTVTATDAAPAPGPFSGSRSYTLTISAQPVTATPVVTTPANGSFVNSTTPTYTGTAPANSTVTVFVDNASIGTTTAIGGTWALTQPTALNQGTHTVYATAQANGAAVSANSNTNTFTVDTVSPTITLGSTATNPTTTSPIPVTVTFSEGVTGFDLSDVTVTNGTARNFSGSGSLYTFSVTPLAAGTVTVNIAANVAQDQAGNGNIAANQFSITYVVPVTATTWTGAVSTDWFTAGNWTSGVPTATVDATIPTAPSGGRFPAITAATTANVRNLSLNSGATLTHTNGTLALAGSLSNNGTYNASNASGNGNGPVLSLGATAPSSIVGSSTTRFWNLTVGANGGLLATSAGASVQRVLTLDGNFSTNGNSFTLESNSAGTAMVVNNGSNVVSGNVTVQRYIDPSLNASLGYRHFSSPISTGTVASLATARFTPVVNPAYNTLAVPGQARPFPTVFGYDQSRIATVTNSLPSFDKGWFSPSALTDALTVGQGYAVNLAANQTFSLTGPQNNGTIVLNVSRNAGPTAAESGLSLVGNPYPSPLNWSLVDENSRPGLDGVIYTFLSNNPADPYAGTYSFYNNGIGNMSPVLALGQGFFVRVTQGQTSATITLQNSFRPTAYTNTTYRRTAADTRPLVHLTLKGAGNTLSDDAFVYFEQGSSEGFDPQYDAVKIPNTSGLNLSTSVTGQQFSIDGRPALGSVQRVIPLAVGVPAPGSYTLASAELANLAATPVYLRDLQLGTVTDLRLTPSYQFTVANSSALLMGRFELVFSPQQVLATAPTALAQQVALYPNPAKKAAFVELPASLGRQAVTATLVDALGRQVRTVQLPAQGSVAHPLDLSDLATGVYALRLSTSAGVVVKKLVIE